MIDGANPGENDTAGGYGGYGGGADTSIGQSAPGDNGAPGVASSYTGSGLSLSGSGLGLSARSGFGYQLAAPSQSLGLSVSSGAFNGFAGNIGASAAVSSLQADAAIAASGKSVTAANAADAKSRVTMTAVKMAVPGAGLVLGLYDLAKQFFSTFGPTPTEPASFGSRAPSISDMNIGGREGASFDSTVIGWNGSIVNGSSSSSSSSLIDWGDVLPGSAPAAGLRSRQSVLTPAQPAAVSPAIALAGLAALLWN